MGRRSLHPAEFPRRLTGSAPDLSVGASVEVKPPVFLMIWEIALAMILFGDAIPVSKRYTYDAAKLSIIAPVLLEVLKHMNLKSRKRSDIPHRTTGN